MPDYYPIMLDVRGRPALVVGGDGVAAEKAAALCASGATVTVLAETFCRALRQMGDDGAVTLRRKAYVPGDLAGAFVVVAATTSDAQLSEAIWHEAQRNGQLLNVVDVPARCTYIVPSILRRGQLTIAVSTEGAAPSLAKLIRRRLEDLFPPAYGSFLRLAAAARGYLRRGDVSYDQRDEFFSAFVASDVLVRLDDGDATGAADTTATLLRRYGVEAPPDKLKEACQDNE